MIILKNTKNTQTVFINKRKDVGLKAAVQYYTKAEADEKFQPKGDYVTPEDIDSIIGSVVDEKVAPFQNEIDELETSKQEVFQVNQPLYFERDNEDLTLNVNLNDYATKEDLENVDISGKQDVLVSGVNIKTINGESILGSGDISISMPTLKYNASTDKFEGDFQAVYSAISSKDSPFSIYLPHNNEVIEATLAFINGTNITAYASITYTGNSMHFAYYIKPDGTYTNAISQFQAQEELTPGDNIDINDDLVISWVAPDVQFVNTIFADNESLKYAIADFKGGYTEKEFPLATTEVAGLMSPEDKAKLDAGSGGGSEITTIILDYNSNSVLKGSYDEVVEALNNKKEVLAYLYYSNIFGKNLLPATNILYPGDIGSTHILFLFHSEEDTSSKTLHKIYEVKLDIGNVVWSTPYLIDYVTQNVYDTKMSEIDNAIDDLQTQVGNVATALDNINGETI